MSNTTHHAPRTTRLPPPVCDAGKKSEAAASACDTCQGGTYSLSEASTCSDCTAGRFSASGASQCSGALVYEFR